MQITNGAKELIAEVLKESGAEGIRLYYVDGCCGPQFALSLDAPMEGDSVQTVNGIRVAMDVQIQDHDELTLDIEEGEEGTGLVLIGAEACGCHDDCSC